MGGPRPGSGPRPPLPGGPPCPPLPGWPPHGACLGRGGPGHLWPALRGPFRRLDGRAEAVKGPKGA
eukprot:982040-Lingulodinium_polyedra.AAC.1